LSLYRLIALAAMNSNPDLAPYLSRGFAPLRIEYDCAELAIDGRIPDELDGVFYRIGPNPQFPPRANYNPLNGDGMVHAFRVHRGRVTYRNRWVRTQQWKIDHEAGRAMFSTSGNPADSDPSVATMRTDGVANTNLVWHGGKLLALEEGHAPIEIHPVTLETMGAWTFTEKLPRNMTAHPKIDPASGEMIFFANFPSGRFNGDAEIYFADAAGVITRSQIVHGPYAALIHDFAITREFVVMFFCPVTVSIKRAISGRPPIAWEPEHGLHVAIVPRNGLEEPRWFSGPAAMAWHSMNAFDDGHRVVVDVCQQENAVFPHADGSPTDPRRAAQMLTRWEFDWRAPGAFKIAPLSDLICEYPRMDERRMGLEYRYGYLACIGGPGTDDIFHRGIARFDHVTRETNVYRAGSEFAVAEPVFVPKASNASEGDGYVMTNIYDEGRDASHLAIFDANAIERGPIARAHLAHRVPVGFHAIWKTAG
jgi:carotenoid cleavage dioxygenase-like enzyme